MPRQRKKEKYIMRIGIAVALITTALIGCSSSGSQAGDTSAESTATTAPLHITPNLAGVAEAHIVVDGAYSDVRYVDMLAAHHKHAIDMAQVEVDNGKRGDLVALARKIIDSQTKEIAELADIKQRLVGSADLPAEMNPHQMENSGVPMPEELFSGFSVDAAFLDGMLPHHSGALQMASVALRNTRDGSIAELSRRTIDEQAEEIGTLIGIRKEAFPQLNHGFPHATATVPESTAGSH